MPHPPDQHHIGLHTLSRNNNSMRQGSQSPPLPPPPEEHADFGRPRQQSLVAPIVPDDQNLPGWVPKNYIEKGKRELSNGQCSEVKRQNTFSCGNLRLLR
jgi:hypothetical protein